MTDEEIIDTYSEIVLFLARARTGQPSDADVRHEFTRPEE